jgi:hypothetical protein
MIMGIELVTQSDDDAARQAKQGRVNMGLDLASTKGEVADGAREMGCGHRGCRPEQFHVHDYQKNREPNTNDEGSDLGQT